MFRRLGKTDICIEEENRSAFIGECKFWHGKSQIADALDQLLGYSTWRDSKAALIVFNKLNRNFSAILEDLPAAIASHELFVRKEEISEAGEWRFIVRSKDDEGRRVILHVFATNIFFDAGSIDITKV